MQSTRIIAESFSHLTKIPGIARIRQELVDDSPEKEHEDSDIDKEHQAIAAAEGASDVGEEQIADEEDQRTAEDNDSGGGVDGATQQDGDADAFGARMKDTADSADPEATVGP